MKKNIKIMALFAVLLTLTLCIFLTSCMEEEFHAVYFASNGGSIVGDISQYVKKGKDATEVTAVANEGFRFVEWSDGLTTASRQDKAITAKLSVTAKFEALEAEDEEIEPTIDPQTEPKGEIVPDEDMPTSEDVLYFSELPPSVSDGTYRVSLSPRIDKASVKSIVIPATYNGKAVTYIENDAFSACPNLEYVYIPSSIKIIGSGAFSYLARLRTLNIPDSVKVIAEGAFKYCNGLESISIPLSLKNIDDELFYNCNSLESIYIPSSVESVGKNAFSSCARLKTVDMSESNVTTIGAYAFSTCSVLEAVYLPDTLEYVGGNAFYHSNNAVIYAPFEEERTLSWHSLWSYRFNGKISFAGKEPEQVSRTTVEAEFSFILKSDNTYVVALANRQYKVVIAVVPETYNGLPVTEITTSGFLNCDFLEEVYIPESVTKIGNGAFLNCANLKIVEMPGVKWIGQNAFAVCPALKEVYLPDTIEYIGGNAFRSATQNGEITEKVIYVPFGENRTVEWSSTWAFSVTTIVYDYVCESR